MKPATGGTNGFGSSGRCNQQYIETSPSFGHKVHHRLFPPLFNAIRASRRENRSPDGFLVRLKPAAHVSLCAAFRSRLNKRDMF
jgi:hypothetical protein